MIAPRPPAASSPPAASLPYPALTSIGYATEPIVTVVATPEPEGPLGAWGMGGGRRVHAADEDIAQVVVLGKVERARQPDHGLACWCWSPSSA